MNEIKVTAIPVKGSLVIGGHRINDGTIDAAGSGVIFESEPNNVIINGDGSTTYVFGGDTAGSNAVWANNEPQPQMDHATLDWAKRVDGLTYERDFYKKRFEEMAAANLSLRKENNDLKAEVEKMKAQVPKRFKRIG